MNAHEFFIVKISVSTNFIYLRERSQKELRFENSLQKAPEYSKSFFRGDVCVCAYVSEHDSV